MVNGGQNINMPTTAPIQPVQQVSAQQSPVSQVMPQQEQQGQIQVAVQPAVNVQSSLQQQVAPQVQVQQPAQQVPAQQSSAPQVMPQLATTGNIVTADQTVTNANDQINEQEQNDLRECLETMTNAFNEFHEQIGVLKSQQKNVIQHIRERIDLKKIEEIKNTLNQA